MGTTLKQIAQLAGVSIGTVDRALHDRGRVDKDVAIRIKQLAAELNYKPNAAARTLKTGNQYLRIAVILHIEKFNAFTEQVLEGVRQSEKELESAEVSVKIFTSKDFDVGSQLEKIDQAIEEHYNGIIITPINDPQIITRINELTSAGYPVILLTNMLKGCHCQEYIGCNYHVAGATAAGLAARLANSKGRILHFSPSFQMYGHVLRSQGILDVLKQDYPEMRVDATVEVCTNEIENYKLVQETISRYPDPDVIICPGAFSEGIFTAIRETTVPERTKVICYDTSDTVFPLLKSGRVSAAITQDPQRQGYTAVFHMYSLLIGKPLAKKEANYYIASRIVLQENISELNYL